jgi:hypothetical protein
MKKIALFLLLGCLFHNLPSSTSQGYWDAVTPFLKVATIEKDHHRTFVHDPLLYIEKWDTLPQLVFWRSIMNLGEDSSVLSLYPERIVLDKLSGRFWDAKSEEEQDAYKDSIRNVHGLDSNHRILYTTGKKEFYNFEFCLNSIEMGIKVFHEQCTQPWYAQAILLIESPGHNYKSPAGALGSFQLMKSVARKFGLKVNRDIDERQDFEKSAVAASRLIDEICVPQAKAILEDMGIHYHESDLWFRLLVLHVYHAGAANVRGVLNAIQPERGGIELITTLWKTEHGRFKNASQNYSQVALASLLELDQLLLRKNATIQWLED